MIRRATVGDIPRMVELGERFHNESHYAQNGVTYSHEKMAASLGEMVGANSCVVLVAERDGETIGGAAAIANAPYMTVDVVATEIFWWMLPSERGHMDGIRLLMALENWAKNVGAKAFSMISLGAIEGGMVERIYQRLGYTMVERSWIKRF